MMTSAEIRKKFIEYFKAHGHTIVPSSSLIPDDPSVLLTTAGMQQFKKYYTGEADSMTIFGSKNTASIQKSFRTSDIDEIGDDTHLTFFEMVGNFSFGGYFKKEAITLAFNFITKELSLSISYVTIFEGSEVVPKDEESRTIWQGLGVVDIREEGMDDVFWGPTGSEGPCGPTTEIYCKNAKGQDVEIWNIVFNQFFYTGSREELLTNSNERVLKPLEIPGIDTGMGLERLCMISQHTDTIFETDLFSTLTTLVPAKTDERIRRIMADHARGVTFLLADGVRPSNKEAGYILRRLMRRAMAYEKIYELPSCLLDSMVGGVTEYYSEWYPELSGMREEIILALAQEREKFSRTIERGVRELSRLETIDAPGAFKLYETFGLPYEIIKEVGEQRASSLTREAFDEAFKKHQELSRAGAEKKFGGHGLILDTGELKAGSEEELKIVTRLHTATHVMQQALRQVLGLEVHQAGSDITAERSRFDFTFARKLTD